MLQTLFRRFGDLLSSPLYDLEGSLCGLDIRLQHPEVFCCPLEVPEPLLLLLDSLLDCHQLLLPLRQLPDATVDQVFSLLGEVGTGLPVNEFCHLVRNADAAYITLPCHVSALLLDLPDSHFQPGRQLSFNDYLYLLWTVFFHKLQVLDDFHDIQHFLQCQCHVSSPQNVILA